MADLNGITLRVEKSRQLLILSLFAGAGALLLALVVLFSGIIRTWAGLDVYALSVLPYTVALVFALVSAFYAHFSMAANTEEGEKAALEKRKRHLGTFDSAEDVRFTAGKSFSNFRKYAPGFTALLGAVIIGVILFAFWKSWGARVEKIVPSNSLHTAFVSAILMCFAIFGGAFCLGQSRDPGFRWLRPAGAWLCAGFLVSLTAALAAFMGKFNHPEADYYAARIIFWIFAALGAELLMSFIAEFYRPRSAEEARPVFESRLLGLVTEPGGVMRNLADTLDYQFGFKVSRTWIYGFIENALTPLFIIWLFSLWIFTCFTEVGKSEIGIRERFGRALEGNLSPGVYFKLPWPFEAVARYPVDLVREVIVGPDIKGEKNDKTPPDIVLWTKSHYAKESMFLVASEKHSGDTKEAPVSFLSVSLPIQYKIRPDRIFDFAYRHNNGEKFLRNIGEREAVKYFAGVDILKVMSFGRGKAVEDLKKMIQTESDKEDLGVDILFVNLHDAHPPIEKVAPAFQDVIGALEDKESEILKADAFKNTVIPGAEAEAEKLRFEALSYSANITAVSKAESERFVKQLAAFSVMPGMFKLRTYLDFLENDCKHLRKFITSSSIPSEIYEVNLEEKARLDLLDANLGDIAPAKK